MAGASLLALLDDIATVLDDVALLTKVAVKKTSGVLGDDLALNAQQVADVRAERELPVVWAVAVGSLKNKAILVPAALLVSALAPWAVLPMLMIGGAYLCFEGVEKLWHKIAHGDEEAAAHRALSAALIRPDVDLVELEGEKIKGAIRTDFVLSAEIVVIALGIVTGKPLVAQVIVLVAIALAMTVGVYGLVAAIVKLDDGGAYLTRAYPGGPLSLLGRGLLAAAPLMMKLLAIVGTAAMFLVGGGIVVHGWPRAHHGIEEVSHAQGGVVGPLIEAGANVAVGVIVGAVCLLVWSGVARLRGMHR